MAKAFEVRVIIHTRERSGATYPQRLLNRTNHTISPLFRFSLDAEGTLYMSERTAKSLDIAKCQIRMGAFRQNHPHSHYQI
eukprot:scaffold6386_cov114-Isochrysis_galbana.AAC.2